MSEQQKKGHHKRKNIFGAYISKILIFLGIALAGTLLVLFFAMPTVSSYVHKAESAYGRSVNDISLDESFTPASLEAPPEAESLEAGKKLAVIKCDEVGLNAPVFYGAERASMRKGGGFYSKDSLFGEGGRSYVAGYIETYFAPLKYISVDDEIKVTTEYGEFKYSVTDVYEGATGEYPSAENGDTLVLAGIYPMLSDKYGSALYVVAQGEVN